MGTAAKLSDRELSECQQLIQRKVRRFFGRQLTHHDYEDACSHSMTQVLAKLSRFDPDRGTLLCFLDRVVANCLVDIARHQMAGKRGEGRGCQSLSVPVSDADGNIADFWQSLDERILRHHRSGVPREATDVAALRIDLRNAIAGLAPHERILLRSKLAGATNGELAKEFSVCRGTIHRWLRCLQAKLGPLADYLE